MPMPKPIRRRAGGGSAPFWTKLAKIYPLACTNEHDPAGTRSVIGNLVCSRRMGIVFRCHSCAGSNASKDVHRAEGSSAGHGRSRMDRAWLHEGKPVFLHDVQRSALKPLRQKIFDEVCAVRRRKPSAQPFVNWPEKLLDPLHAARLSESSSKPRRGIASPMPTRSARISQGRSSGSQISSMLARLKIVVA